MHSGDPPSSANPLTFINPRAPGLEPIRAVSVPGFGLCWIGLLLALITAFGWITVRWVNYYTKEGPAWINNLYSQKKVIADRQAARGKRLIVAGGSGVLFGIDAELIEKRLGIPTLNYGTHAGLGMRYLLDRALRLSHPGDTILVAIEYGTWGDQWRLSPGTFHSFVWTYDKPYIARMGLFETPEMLFTISQEDYLQSRDGWKLERSGDYHHLYETIPYSIGTLSPNGDIRISPGSGPAFQPTKPPYVLNPGWEDISAFRSFCRKAKSKHVNLLYTWCSYVRPILKAGESIDPPQYMTDLLRETGITVLDKPTDNMFPEPWYLDSEYHPNSSARRIRTEELIRRLRPAMGMAPVSPIVKNMLLVADRDHRMTGGNLFLNDPALEVRYLWPTSLDDPRAITPSQVADTLRQGINVYTDSQAARKLLASAGMTCKTASIGREPVGQWFARHKSNLVMLGNVPGVHIDPAWEKAVPPEVYKALASGEPTAVIYGTGRYSKVLCVSSQPHYVILEADTTLLVRPKSKVPAILRVQSMAEKYGGPKLWMAIDYYDGAMINSGLCAIAIDPEVGAKVDTVFPDGSDTIETWRLDRVFPAALP